MARWAGRGRRAAGVGVRTRDLDAEVQDVRHGRDPERARPTPRPSRSGPGRPRPSSGRHAPDRGPDLRLVDGRSLQPPGRHDHRDGVPGHLGLAQGSASRNRPPGEARLRGIRHPGRPASSRRLSRVRHEGRAGAAGGQVERVLLQSSSASGSGSKTGSPKRAPGAKSSTPAVPRPMAPSRRAWKVVSSRSSERRLRRVDVGLLDEQADAARAARGGLLVGDRVRQHQGRGQIRRHLDDRRGRDVARRCP